VSPTPKTVFDCRGLCGGTASQRPSYEWRCLPPLLTPPILTHPFLLPAATSAKSYTRNIWLGIFSLNLCLGLGLLLYGLALDDLCARVFPSFSFICAAECCFLSVGQHHASVLSCPVFVKRWSFPVLSCRFFFGIECDVFIPVFVLLSDKLRHIISICYCTANFLFN